MRNDVIGFRASHAKMLYPLDADEDTDWVCLGSANLSNAAWGSQTWGTYPGNWELSVVVPPSSWRLDQARSTMSDLACKLLVGAWSHSAAETGHPSLGAASAVDASGLHKYGVLRVGASEAPYTT